MLNRLADYSIDRPVFIIVLLILALIAGGYAYTKIPVEAVPEVVIPIVLVMTPWPGVGPEEIEEEVTKPLETAFSQMDELDCLESYSYEGMSFIVIQFIAGGDLDKSLDEVQEKVNKTRSELPDDTEDPVVHDLNFGDMPILELGLAGNLPPQELRQLAEDFADEIEAIDDVGRVLMAGEATEEVRIAVDPYRLSALGLSFDDITRVLQSENLNVPAGNLSPGEGRWLVRATGEFTDIETISNLPLRATASGVLRLRDVAEVTLNPEERESYSRLDGREAIGLFIQKKSGTNTIRLAEQVFDVIDEWEPVFEEKDVEVVIVSDMAEFISDRFAMMNLSARYGILLVVLIVWFFIGFRNSIIVALAIPCTLTMSFGLMYILGVTLSDTSTFAIILVLGMLVDEDIVVVENTYRHLQYGETRIEAARKGIHEVGTPIFAAVLTTLAAFLPILIMSGIMGEFMKYIPMTVAFVLICAFILAHTVLPVLTSIFLRIKKSDLVGGSSDGADVREDDMPVDGESNNKVTAHYLFLPWLLRPYERLLKWSLGSSKLGRRNVSNHHFLAGIAWTLLFLAVFGITQLDQELFPDVAIARFNISMRTPEGTDIDETDRNACIMENWVQESPDVKHYLLTVGRSGSSGPFSFITSVDPTLADFSIELNERSDEKNNDLVDRVIDEFRERSRDLAGVDIEFSRIQAGPPVGAPIMVRVMGDRMEILHGYALQIEDELESINDELESSGRGRPITQIRNDYPDAIPELRVTVDRERAARLGLSTAQVAMALRTALAGTESTEYTIEEEDRTVDLVVRLPEEQRLTFDDIRALSFRSPVTGALVPFSAVAEIETGKGYSTLQRRDQRRVVEVRMELGGISPYEVDSMLRLRLEEISEDFLPGYTWEIGGEQEMTSESFSELFLALIISVLLIYVILVWVFNSPIQPLTIMVSIPFAIIGIVLGLILTAQPFGLLPFMALVALSGIVVNDSIVLITYINQLRASGKEKKAAIVQACITRLRPIIMTSVTTSLGILPLTLGWGAPSNEAGAWFPFGVSMIFGLMTATVLILIIIPTVYNVMTNWEEKLAPRFRRDR